MMHTIYLNNKKTRLDLIRLHFILHSCLRMIWTVQILMNSLLFLWHLKKKKKHVRIPREYFAYDIAHRKKTVSEGFQIGVEKLLVQATTTVGSQWLFLLFFFI